MDDDFELPPGMGPHNFKVTALAFEQTVSKKGTIKGDCHLLSKNDRITGLLAGGQGKVMKNLEIAIQDA